MFKCFFCRIVFKSSSFSVRFVAVSVLLLCAITQAQAEHWEVERYVWNGSSGDTEGRVYSGYGIKSEARSYNLVVKDNVKVSSTYSDSNYIHPDHSRVYWHRNWNDPWPNSSSSYSVQTLTNSINASVYAVFKWHRKQLPNPNSYRETYDDPSDNPPRFLYTREKGRITANKWLFINNASLDASALP